MMLTTLAVLASIALLPLPAQAGGEVVAEVLPRMGMAALQIDGAAEAARLRTEVQALSDDIDLLGKLNRLQLSKAQIQGLADIAQKREAIRAASAPKRIEVQTALGQALRQKRQLMLKDQPVPDALEDKIARLNTEVQVLSRSENDQAAKLMEYLRKLLTAPQWAMLTGRSEAEASAVQMLEWLRQLPAAQYEDEADGAAEELESPGAGLTMEKIRAIFNKMREMKGPVFEQQKKKLAEELLPAYAMSAKAEQDTVLELVSNERIVPLLQDMLAARGG
jgi:hypothetical protein